MSTEITVGLVEDQHLFRQGLKAILQRYRDINVDFESANGYSVMGSFEKMEQLPDIMLIDLRLPPDGQREYNGFDLIRDLHYRYPEIGLMALSVEESQYYIVRAIEMGASGYLLKDSDPEEVHQAIVKVHQTGSYINAQTLVALQGRLSGQVKTPKKHEQLTSREIEVLELVCQQMTAAEIGERLFISTKTVNGHKNNLLQKTESRNMAGLVLYAVKHNLIDVNRLQ